MSTTTNCKQRIGPSTLPDSASTLNRLAIYVTEKSTLCEYLRTSCCLSPKVQKSIGIKDEGKSSTQSKYRRSRSPAQKYMRDLRYEWLSPSEVLPALSFNPCLYKCIYSVMNPPFQL